jgi:hypothetical protein
MKRICGSQRIDDRHAPQYESRRRTNEQLGKTISPCLVVGGRDLLLRLVEPGSARSAHLGSGPWREDRRAVGHGGYWVLLAVTARRSIGVTREAARRPSDSHR